MRPPQRSVEVTQVTEWDDGAVRPVQDSLAAEDPLEIRIGGTPVTVTMRTPGHNVELAAGFCTRKESVNRSIGLPGSMWRTHRTASQDAMLLTLF